MAAPSYVAKSQRRVPRTMATAAAALEAFRDEVGRRLANTQWDRASQALYLIHEFYEGRSPHAALSDLITYVKYTLQDIKSIAADSDPDDGPYWLYKKYADNPPTSGSRRRTETGRGREIVGE